MLHPFPFDSNRPGRRVGEFHNVVSHSKELAFVAWGHPELLQLGKVDFIPPTPVNLREQSEKKQLRLTLQTCSL